MLEGSIVVRDMRTNERFWVHDMIVDEYGPLLGADVFAIYSSLSCMANKDQYCWPSLSRLARHWGKGRATIVRAVTLLSDLKLIHVQRGMNDDGSKANNVYYLLEPLPIEEGLASLVGAFRQGECTWTSDRTCPGSRAAKLGAFTTQERKVALSQRLVASPGIGIRPDPERIAEAATVARSGEEPGGSGREPGSSVSELGGIGVEPGGFEADPGHFSTDQDGSAPVPRGVHARSTVCLRGNQLGFPRRR